VNFHQKLFGVHVFGSHKSAYAFSALSTVSEAVCLSVCPLIRVVYIITPTQRDL